MQDVDLTSKDLAVLKSPMELMERQWAPCRYNCPVHADVQRYVDLAAQGKFKESVDAVRENLPFSVVCGRICHHPCENNCRRNDVDKPVAIREIKRFVAEYIGLGATVHKAMVQDKAKIAVIGAGPAGLSAALDLAKLGYRPTVFEKFGVGGGIAATAVPKYRLPKDKVQIDVDWILAHGIELKTNMEVGKDKTIADLRREGFEAVLIAVGLAKGRILPLPGVEHRRVYDVMRFLTNLVFGEKVDIGSDVLVIGGGNVACDAARSAVRLGAKRVRMVCLENEQEIPAWSWEVREAREEGIETIHRRGPVEIVIKDGAITALRTRKVTSVFDQQKRFNPQYDDRDMNEIACDTVIFAIGQAADTGFTRGSDLKLDERGRLVFDARTHQTSLGYVFACGEIVTAPGSVVEACANGQRAAKAIDMYLSGRSIEINDALPPYIEKIAAKTAEKVIHVERVLVPTDGPAKRIKSFDEFEHTYDPESSACEGRRCMNCGTGAQVLIDKCVACLTCLRVCPFDIPRVTDAARIESSLCQACGICIAECPANAIIARGRDLDQLIHETAGALEKARQRRIAAYICGHRASAKAWQESNGSVKGISQFYLPSMARLRVLDLLSAFEHGADLVVVVACEDEAERYPDATERIRRRVEQTRRMLAEAGMNPAALKMFEVPGDAESIRAVLEAVQKEITS